MKKITYLTTDELISRAREKIVPIPSQEKAQKEIATLISMHLNNIKAIENGVQREELPSLTSYILGSTGSGKSYITKNLSKICGLNFERVDCANLTQSGCRGRNLSNVFSDIIAKNHGWFDEGGILLFDEADKMRYVGDNYYDAFSPQQDFLCILENGECTFTNEAKDTITVNLNKTLILFAGACAKITPLLEAKYRKKQLLGFASDDKSKVDDKSELLSKTTLEDLKNYGFMTELCGRMQRIIYIPEIDIEGYKQLITDSANTSAINKYRNCFNMKGVSFDISDNAVNLIAQTSMKQQLGARSIESVLGKAVIDAYDYVDNHPKCNKVTLTVKDDEFKIKYLTGKRKFQEVLTSNKQEIDLEIDLRKELSSKYSIDGFCLNLTSCVDFEDRQQEELFFSFLHTACYYLAHETLLSERTYKNLIKLAEATKNKSGGPDSISAFEIICNDYIAEAKSDDIRFQDGFLPYYVFFKKLKTNINASSMLVEALHKANGPYQILKK